ncbi:MAG TPA: DUF3667 domain-containing protein [Longimicrobium sp.]|nr:DUF3667 domain-containing protein [Longimicrobium sp.]
MNLPPDPPAAAPRAVAAPPRPIPTLGASKRRTPDRPCLNCGDATVGNFCPACGQRKVEVRISLRRMLMEALDDQFSVNSALPRTLGALFFRPGHLTREYMAGRIVRYIPPFRLYLVSSVAFFLALSFSPGVRAPLKEGHISGITLGTDTARAEARRAQVPPPEVPAPGSGAAIQRPPPPPAPPGAGWMGDVNINTGNVTVDSILRAKVDRLNRMPPEEAVGQVMSDYMEHVPQMMFVLLPVFAAILKLLYLRRGRFYVEHFVFALHTHAVAFLTYTAILLSPWRPAEGVLGLWIILYVYLAMKAVYGQGWIKTGAKYMTLGFTYFTTMLLAGFALLIVTLLMM